MVLRGARKGLQERQGHDHEGFVGGYQGVDSVSDIAVRGPPSYRALVEVEHTGRGQPRTVCLQRRTGSGFVASGSLG